MQLSLFDGSETQHRNIFPSTRYQGSKAKFTEWIWREISDIPFHTALDAFGGTGSVAYKLKYNDKSVTYNDILPYNTIIGKAIIENNSTVLTDDDIDYIIAPREGVRYPTFISDTFKDIYYTDEENQWLDIVRYNISTITDSHKRAIAWFALFQSCIIKRPYNLFHRKNLYVRMTDVPRSFGNKRTWDTPFETHFRAFVNEANRAVFDNGEECRALNRDAQDIHDEYDLVYIDTPYLNERGVGVDYADFYHSLNGLLFYDSWADMIDFKSKHHRIKRVYSIWNDKNNILVGFNNIIENFKNSILVFSYRSNGIPSIEQLVSLMNDKGRRNSVRYSRDIKYALSDSKSKEVIIISYPR